MHSAEPVQAELSVAESTGVGSGNRSNRRPGGPGDGAA